MCVFSAMSFVRKAGVVSCNWIIDKMRLSDQKNHEQFTLDVE